LKQDKKAIFKAASLAREAAEMLTGKAEAEDVTEAA
jgi:antirestriction protein ArdC